MQTLKRDQRKNQEHSTRRVHRARVHESEDVLDSREEGHIDRQPVHVLRVESDRRIAGLSFILMGIGFFLS